MALYYPPFFDYIILDRAGKPAAGGTLNAYYSATNVPLAIYNSAGNEIVQPLVIGSDGRVDFRMNSDYVYRIVIKDSTSFTLIDKSNIMAPGAGAVGPQGPQGPQGVDGITGSPGPAGVGVPTGGDAGQVLSKIDGTDYNTEWINVVDPIVYVPYTGATQSVQLGQNDLLANAIVIQESSGNVEIGTLDSLASNIKLTNTTAVGNPRIELNSDGTVKLKTDFNPQVSVSSTTSSISTTTLNGLFNNAAVTQLSRSSDGVNATNLIQLDGSSISINSNNAGGGSYGQISTAPGGTRLSQFNSSTLKYLDLLTTGQLQGSYYAGAGNQNLCVDNDGKIKTAPFGLFAVTTTDSASITFTGDGTVASPLSATAIAPANTCLMPISYGLVGSVSVAQSMKRNVDYSSPSGWYLPTGNTATLNKISVRGRSVNAAGAGAVLSVKVFSWTKNNGTQRGVGAGTLVGSEYTLYTTAIGGTYWDPAGTYILPSPVSMTSDLIYYVDVSTISLTMDDIEVDLYVELS